VLGVPCEPLLVTALLVPPPLADEGRFSEGTRLLEVHECLTALTPWAGPLLIDVTWDPALLARGLPGTFPWDGTSDMRVAVLATGPGWAVPLPKLRAAKESLRSRLYGPGDRAARERVLAKLATLFASWRAQPI